MLDKQVQGFDGIIFLNQMRRVLCHVFTENFVALNIEQGNVSGLDLGHTNHTMTVYIPL